MGFGALSSQFSYIPRYLPAKPPTPPKNVAASTNRSRINIEYNALIDGADGGSPILKYNIYIDDGDDGDFSKVAENNPTVLTWNTPNTLLLKTGAIYRFKYSATNIHGEGPLSEEVQILVAEYPSAPSNLKRVNTEALVAGQIRMTWTLPADEGGSPVTGYLIYLDQVLFYDARGVATLNEFTFTSLNVAQMYTVGVSAVNDLGEGIKATMTQLAASVPVKLAAPTLISSTMVSITVRASSTSFNGGAEVTFYAFRRDDGPATPFKP